MINKLIKSLFGLFIVGFGIINFSSAVNEIGNCYSFDWGTYSCYELDIDEDFTYGNITSSVKDFFNFNTSGLKYFGVNRSRGSRNYYVFWSGNSVVSVGQNYYSSRGLIGTLPGFCVYNGIDAPGLFNTCGTSRSNWAVGQYTGYYINYNTDLSTLKSYIGNSSLTKVYVSVEDGNGLFVCGVYEDVEKSFCVASFPGEALESSSFGIRQSLSDIYIDFSDNNSVGQNYILDFVGDMTDSPLEFSGGGGEGSNIGPGGIELGSVGSAINYYEKTYGWDESICYVGIDNYTDLWGTPVSFEQGSGLSIFQLFSGLYGNTDLNKVYVWLNSWLLNYEQWYGVNGGFGTVGDPHYLATYNSGTNRVDLYYTGFSFPFANNPVAIYFMADYIESKSMYSTMGSSVVSYCNLKINGGSFEDIVDQADKNNINGYTEQSNTNKGLNPDGTEKDYNFPGGSDYGTGDRVILTGNVGSWTGMTWEDMQYSGDVSLKDFFENAIDEMKSAMDNNMDSPFTGVLPQYIISAFLFVCLFRLLRK